MGFPGQQNYTSVASVYGKLTSDGIKMGEVLPRCGRFLTEVFPRSSSKGRRFTEEPVIPGNQTGEVVRKTLKLLRNRGSNDRKCCEKTPQIDLSGARIRNRSWCDSHRSVGEISTQGAVIQFLAFYR